jgi:hypothetical protein
MPTAHLYLFSDACPSDWLVDGHDDVWHTIVNVAFQSAPELQTDADGRLPHYVVLMKDPAFVAMIEALKSKVPSGVIRKWATGPGYRASFCRAFSDIWPTFRPLVAACSFQEKSLRASKQGLLNSYNRHIGGIEGRGIGFEEYEDDRGRRRMKHSFVDMSGYHEIKGLENQVLVLLFMSWFVADQYIFYFRDIVQSGRHGFDRLALTVVSDKLSGDDDSRPHNEQNLRRLVDPQDESVPIVLTRSPKSDVFPGDLLVDNLAGWLNAAISAPSGEFSSAAASIATSGVWAGWHVLKPSSERLESTGALSRLENPKTV